MKTTGVKILAIAFITLLPMAVSAQQRLTGIRELIVSVGDLVRVLTLIIAAVALLAFFFGLAKFIFKVGGDEKAVDAGKTLMIWGLIALFVMVSVWGIIGFFQRELGLPGTSSGLLPNNALPGGIFNGPSATPNSPSQQSPQGFPGTNI